MKIIIFSLEILFEPALGSTGNFLLWWLDEYPKFKLIFVMVIAPVVLNTLMFWVTDSFLKSNKYGKSYTGKSYNETLVELNMKTVTNI
jgi:hypothetical protein